MDGRETGDFLPEDFKNGEYEAAVRLEKQEDLKTVTDHILTRRNLTYKEEKVLEAEVKFGYPGLFYVSITFISECLRCRSKWLTKNVKYSI